MTFLKLLHKNREKVYLVSQVHESHDRPIVWVEGFAGIMEHLSQHLDCVVPQVVLGAAPSAGNSNNEIIHFIYSQTPVP